MSGTRVKSSQSSKFKNPQKTKIQKRNVAKKVRKQKLGFVAKVAFVMIILVLFAKSWDNWNKIQDRNEQITELEQEHNHRRISNDALQQKVDAPVDEEYIIDVAREQGYRGSDEILFYLNDGE